MTAFRREADMLESGVGAIKDVPSTRAALKQASEVIREALKP
jgi:hypothetical protein